MVYTCGRCDLDAPSAFRDEEARRVESFAQSAVIDWNFKAMAGFNSFLTIHFHGDIAEEFAANARIGPDDPVRKLGKKLAHLRGDYSGCGGFRLIERDDGVEIGRHIVK